MKKANSAIPDPNRQKIKFYHMVENSTDDKGYEKKVDNLLSLLSEREKAILVLRFGLEDGKPKKLEELGELFSVSGERIRQIQNQALRKLRRPLRNQPHADTTNLKKLYLSSRSFNCLMRAGICSIEDIIDCPKESWAKIKYLRQQDKKEIERKIHSLGYESFSI